ncbi:serine carboxypeptidase-like 1 isoform X4 [Quercus robur]|uniref:serine carboxypeptidase-like 1 isoform X4 n=1 Tax=Quercus robur TaxID=38942 RepID=UPI0021629087|nr:serine carboxypeptidase-like 1 isoform X4 [Quercus robur]
MATPLTPNPAYKCMTKLFSHILLIVLFLTIVESQSIIESLPGYSGSLPFKLETGYIGVGDLDDVQLFYYFIESERSPKDDPLVLWLTGGPGCSAFSGLVFEIGFVILMSWMHTLRPPSIIKPGDDCPLSFDFDNSSRDSPTFKLNPFSWTKVANIIFVDAPVGTGFSYARSWEGYSITDTISAAQTYSFLRKWLLAHPAFHKNQLYVAGDSYSGILVPIIVQKISDGNEAGVKPAMNLQGYVLGNPTTTPHDDYNYRIPFAYMKALISQKQYESIKTNCKGEYINVDPNNTLCVNDLHTVTDCTQKIYSGQILEPTCSLTSPKPVGSKLDASLLGEDAIHLLSLTQVPELWCRGTIREWIRCNASLSYTDDVFSTLEYHRNLIKKGYRILIYSGDHDMVIPHISTYAWIESLNLTIATDWGPWFVDGQIAGYTMESYYKKSRLTYATVKGAGHTAPEYKPKECFAMVNRWFAYYPL